MSFSSVYKDVFSKTIRTEDCTRIKQELSDLQKRVADDYVLKTATVSGILPSVTGVTIPLPPPPLPPGGGPPPPPPLPPVGGFTPPPRGGLLSAIQNGTKLKKSNTISNDIYAFKFTPEIQPKINVLIDQYNSNKASENNEINNAVKEANKEIVVLLKEQSHLHSMTQNITLLAMTNNLLLDTHDTTIDKQKQFKERNAILKTMETDEESIINTKTNEYLKKQLKFRAQFKEKMGKILVALKKIEGEAKTQTEKKTIAITITEWEKEYTFNESNLVQRNFATKIRNLVIKTKGEEDYNALVIQEKKAMKSLSEVYIDKNSTKPKPNNIKDTIDKIDRMEKNTKTRNKEKEDAISQNINTANTIFKNEYKKAYDQGTFQALEDNYNKIKVGDETDITTVSVATIPKLEEIIKAIKTDTIELMGYNIKMSDQYIRYTKMYIKYIQADTTKTNEIIEMNKRIEKVTENIKVYKSNLKNTENDKPGNAKRPLTVGFWDFKKYDPDEIIPVDTNAHKDTPIATVIQSSTATKSTIVNPNPTVTKPNTQTNTAQSKEYRDNLLQSIKTSSVKLKKTKLLETKQSGLLGVLNKQITKQYNDTDDNNSELNDNNSEWEADDSDEDDNVEEAPIRSNASTPVSVSTVKKTKSQEIKKNNSTTDTKDFQNAIRKKFMRSTDSDDDSE